MSIVRILVVEDIKYWREFVSSMLRKEPSFEIICEAVDGAEAVVTAEKLKPTVVLLDIGLPKMNGIEAGKWIGKLVPETKVVFFSEEHDMDIVLAALKIGASGYVLKSDATHDLIAAIHAAVKGDKFVSRTVASNLPTDFLP